MVVERIGEVVESSSMGFTVQCYRLYGAPPLGALVRTAESAVYGVIYNVTTSGLDPSRKPVARGQEEATEEAIYLSNPQLAQLLRTDFQILALGYSNGGSVHHLLPPSPPRIYAFVHSCTEEEVRGFTSTLGFLPMLLGGQFPNRDELVISCLHQVSTAYSDSQAFLVQAGRELASHIGDDSQRLNTMLRRLLA